MKYLLAAAIVIITLIASLTVSGVIFKIESSNHEPEVFDSTVKIEPDKKTYAQDELIELQLTLVNNRNYEMTYKGSGAGHRANVWIYDSDGVEVWNNVPEFSDMDYDEIKVPAKSEFFLQTVYWSQVDNTGAPVNPGRYDIVSMNDHMPAETGVCTIVIS